MVKKSMRVGIFIIIVMILALGGCGNEKNEQQDKIPESIERTSLKFAAGPKGSGYFEYGEVVSDVVNQQSQKVSLEILKTDSLSANLEKTLDGGADVAIIRNDIAYDAIRSFGGDSGEIKALAAVYSEVYEVIADAGSGIRTIQDLRGKRVAVGKKDSDTAALTSIILQSHEMDLGSIEAKYMDLGEAVQAMEKGEIDAIVYIGPVKSDAIDKLSKTKALTVVSIDDGGAADVLLKYPYFVRYAYPDNLYKSSISPGETLAIRVSLAAKSSISEQDAYLIVKTVFENRYLIADNNIWGFALNLDDAAFGNVFEIHLGARQYFEESGVLNK